MYTVATWVKLGKTKSVTSLYQQTYISASKYLGAGFVDGYRYV